MVLCAGLGVERVANGWGSRMPVIRPTV